jgi:hypothetical protein
MPDKSLLNSEDRSSPMAKPCQYFAHPRPIGRRRKLNLRCTQRDATSTIRTILRRCRPGHLYKPTNHRICQCLPPFLRLPCLRLKCPWIDPLTSCKRHLRLAARPPRVHQTIPLRTAPSRRSHFRHRALLSPHTTSSTISPSYFSIGTRLDGYFQSIVYRKF